MPRTALHVRQLALVLAACAAASSCVSTTSPLILVHPEGSGRTDVPENGRPFAVRISRSGVLLVGEQDDARLGRYNLPATVATTVVRVGDDPADMGFSPDGRTAYVANLASGTVGVLDLTTNTQITTIGMPSSPYRIAVEPDGSRIYVTTAAGQLVTINAATRAATLITLNGPLNGIALHPSLPLLYVSSTAGFVYEVSRNTGQVTRFFNEPGTPQEVLVSTDGAMLYIARENDRMDVRSTGDLATVQQGDFLGSFGMAVSPDNQELYVTFPQQSLIRVLDRATLATRRTYFGGSPRRVTFDQTGTTAVIGNEANYVTFIR